MGVAVQTLNVGCVSYLNARPLIAGLDREPGVALHLDVPSALPGGLREGRFDIALLPVIDYQRLKGLTLLPAGGIASDGATLTVRIFSRVPIAEIGCLACDPDSHTSVALARILLARRHGIRPEFTDLSKVDGGRAEAMLLIGDKVVCEQPAGYPHQLDCGEAWKALTGLPCVFAAWFAREGVELGGVAERLKRAREEGMGNIERIISTYAVPRGWPVELARRYLTEYLRFEIGPRELEAIRLFYEMAAAEGLIASPPKPLVVAGGG